MKDSYRLRDYQKGDERAILDLFRSAFQKTLPEPFWKWRFLDNPAGTGAMKLLWDGDLLIGHYATIPMRIQVSGIPQRAMFSMTTMTHPDYGGQGIFTFLAEKCYSDASDAGYIGVYGFPNKNSHPGFTRKLAWIDLGQVSSLNGTLTPGTGRAGKVRIEAVESFPEELDTAWTALRGLHPISVERTSEYLNWRFTANPEAAYDKLISRADGRINGYLVLKRYEGGSHPVGHFVDLVCEDETGCAALVDAGMKEFAGRGIERIRSWFPDGSMQDAEFRKRGFVREPTETYFGVRPFKQAVDARFLGEAGNWFLTMGDSDVF